MMRNLKKKPSANVMIKPLPITKSQIEARNITVFNGQVTNEIELTIATSKSS